ncbi:MAG TPA: ABC transporter substrate-binding protein, partial [Pyrinomonadaceae bacterium]
MTTRFRRPRRNAFILTLLLLLPMGACQQATAPPANTTNTATAGERTAGVRGGSLTYRLTEPPTGFNPVMASREADFVVSFFLAAGRLIEFDHDKRSYAPSLAESWRLLEDGRTVELTLRDGLKFSDGQPLSTADVEFTMRAIYSEPSSIIRQSLLFSERPAETRVLDARRFQLVFPEQVAAPETYLVNIPVLPRHRLEEELRAGNFGKAYGVTSDPQQIVTSGAFAFESVAPGERVRLKRNPHYWKKDSAGTQLPYLDNIAIEIVGDQNAALTRLREGGLDLVDRIRPSDYASLQQQTGGVRAVDLGPGLSTDHIFFNLNEGARPPRAVADKQAWFKDARFRRAVSHAIDRDSVASGTLQGLATPLYNFVSPANREWVAADVPRTEFSVERSRALLAEAGFSVRGTAEAPELFDAGGRRVEFTLIVPQESGPRVSTAAAVQEDLAKVGILVNVAPIETGELRRRTLQSYDYEAALFGLGITDFDPSSASGLLASGSPDHQWHPAQTKPTTDWETRLDALVAQLARERDTERRRAVFRDIQLLM